MTNSTRLLLIRHGETLWNTARRMQGQSDSPLSPRGQQQAVAVARRLAGLEPHALYTSDLGRALATSQAIADATGLELRVDERLRERSFGVFEGLTWPEIEARYQVHCEQYLQHAVDWAMPGGESLRQVTGRTLEVLMQIATDHPGQSSVVVAHGGTLAAAFRAATDLDWNAPRRFSILNASLNVIEWRDSHWHLVTWGDIAHCES